MKLRIAFLVCLSLAVIPAAAQTILYSNGGLSGAIDAWTINFGYIVSDSFSLYGGGTVQGFDFYTWSYPGDTPLAVDWSITSQENGGSVYGSGTGAALNNIVITTNFYGYQINKDTVSGLNLDLSGAYWLNLQNGVTSQGNELYWDENDGPSQASENTLGTIGSEAFDLFGASTSSTTTTTSTTSTTGFYTPEPSSILLLGSGVLGLAGVMRRKLF